MALKQMSMARMGQYRPPVQPVGAGGKTGRPKLLHNGDGNGLTGGGGFNSKGSAGGIKVPPHMKGLQRKMRTTRYAMNKTNSLKMADRDKAAVKRQSDQTKGGTTMAPHPVGRFQFGDGQWAFLNAKGLVNWKSTAPKTGQPVIGFNVALPYLRQTGALTSMPTRQAQAPYYEDSLYARAMAQHNAELAAAQSGYEYDKGVQAQAYQDKVTGLTQDNLQANQSQNSGLAGNNLAGSGVASQAIGTLAQQFSDALTSAKTGQSLEDTRIATGLANAQNQYDTTKAGELGVAKERWLSTHPGQASPAGATKGLWKTATGQAMYTNAQGIPISWTPPKKPLTAKPSTVKPKAIGGIVPVN